MSYVDAIFDRKNDKILVAERVDGERHLVEFPAEHIFYYEHPQGSHLSIYGDTCRKFSTNDGQKFRKELGRISAQMSNRKPTKIFESDIRPEFRSLATHYMGVEAPVLNVCFFDIEVDFDPKRGFAPTNDPFNPVTAISLHTSKEERLITLALIPPTYDTTEAFNIGEQFQDTLIFDNEVELLKAFIDLVGDADVLSGWNSTGFDIPYLVNRITRVLSKDATRDLCLWNQLPKVRDYIKFKRPASTYDLVGRCHLDYLELYQKHNPQQLHSYRLDYVGEIEVGENKTVYEGTLDDLYKKDFKRFIEYNRQDTMLLVKIDAKKKFIELANQVAHSNCVLLKTTMGSVSLVETAIINEMHAMGFVVPDRKKTVHEPKPARHFIVLDDDDDDDDDIDDDGRTPVVGAYVADPKKGIHDHIGCVDINSLYPSCIRALNMSPETIFGQVRMTETMALIAERVVKLGPKRRAEAWEGIFVALEVDHMHARDGAPLTVDFEDGTTKTMSGRDLFEYIYNPKNNVCITANGTLFRTDKDGIIPLLLAKWYSERQEMQGKQVSFEELAELESDPDKKKEHLFWAGFWNQRQQARKILLNSLYGALLNEGLRFYDERLGQSVTLTGRSIVRHMNSKINEIICGIYDYKGDAIYYSDTDSSYFSAYMLRDLPAYAGYEWSKDNIIALYQGIEEMVNDSFPEFMNKNFNTTLLRGAIIKAGLELVASKSLFIKKKKYAVLMYYKDGKRLDKNGKPGKLKAMGLDLKRADTPKFMQKFLETLLMELLTGQEKQVMFDQIKVFRREFTTRPGWEKGTPKKVSALSDYVSKHRASQTMSLQESLKLKKGEKVRVNKTAHFHAAMNWNNMCESHGDRYSMRIGDGQKIIVCKLKPNMMKVDSVAYPIDEPHIPEWFKNLPFDHEEMESKIIDNKLKNLVGVLDWDLEATKERTSDEFFVFS
jgi:DNA polymerase elongation subunit (family B)